MTEHLPSTLPAPESLPTTPDVDPEMIDEINSIEESTDTRVTSKWAIRLEITAEKVGSFLEDRAINKAHKEALGEDRDRKAQAQNEAYDSYTENINVVKERESGERSQERRERAKKLFNKIGNASLSFLESQGIIPPRGEWHKQGKGKFNMNFSAWIARKYVAAKERREARAAGFLSEEQNEAVMGETDLVDAETSDADTPELKESTPDKDAESESPATEPDETDTPEITDSKAEATTESETEKEPSDDELAAAAREKAEERAAAAEERRERRRERIKNVSERAKNIVQKLKLGKLGRGALALLGRARASASAAATAWMDFGKE